MLNHSTNLTMSTSDLKALPGKLDIKRHSPSVLYLSVQLFSITIIILLYICSPASWWKFAISIHLTKIQERNKRLTKNYLIMRVQDVVKYTKTYAAELQKQSVDAAAKVRISA